MFKEFNTFSINLLIIEMHADSFIYSKKIGLFNTDWTSHGNYFIQCKKR